MFFFFNRDLLQDYAKAADSQKNDVPGSHYFSNIMNYIDNHYEIGELYMEFLKDDCKHQNVQQVCSSCLSGWIGPKMDDRIPRPFPNKSTFKYN